MKLSTCVLALLLFLVFAGASPLHDAAVNGDGIQLKGLLDSKQYEVNKKDQNGRTPLAAAFATCSNYTGKFPKTVPGGALVFCEPGITYTVASLLICAGADVNVDVFPQKRPGYKLVHIAACHGATGLDLLLAAGADPNVPYTLPANNQTVTPLTWAITCASRIKNNTEYGYPELQFPTLLSAGANPLPNGTTNTPSALYSHLTLGKQPFPLSKCNTPGVCTQEYVDKVSNDLIGTFSGNFMMGSWSDLWLAQERAFKDPKAGPENQPPWATQTIKTEYACKIADDYYNSELERVTEAQAAEQYVRSYPLHAAVAANNLTAVKALVEAPGWWYESNRSRVNDKDSNGLTPLQVGMDCAKGVTWCWPRAKTDVVEYLVRKGANVRLDVYPIQEPGYSLLHKAAFHGLTGIAKVLLKGNPTSKADPNAVYYSGPPSDKQLLTPLIAAAMCDYKLSMGDTVGEDSNNSTILALLAAGANPMPVGQSKPFISYFSVPAAAKKCNDIGRCTEAEARAMQNYFLSGSCPASWFAVWQVQNKLAAAVAAESAVATRNASAQAPAAPRLAMVPAAAAASANSSQLLDSIQLAAAATTAKPAGVTGRRRH